jgi:flagellar hook-associated protein 2
VYVDQLARAQATISQQSFADTGTTLVAGAGTLTFTTAEGDVDVTLSGDVTLQGLADAINATTDSPVSASIFRNTSGEYQLMLTGRETGEANAFTVDTSAFAGPSGGGGAMTFAQAQAARDAQIRLNGVTATSSTNVFEGVISGLTLTALTENVENPVTITISANPDSVVNLVQKVIAAFNDTTNWIGQQQAAATGGGSNIGHDPLVRGLRSQFARAITSSYDVGGSFEALAEVGFEFTRTGTLTLNESTFRQALADNRADVQTLFRGTDGTGGAFGSLVEPIVEYTQAGGLVPNAQNRLTDQLGRLSDRIGDMEERLAVRRAALQKEYAAADAVIAQLNSAKGALSSLGTQFSLF